jgi:nicotinamidase-related amidase
MAWVDTHGKNPNPFTAITLADINSGKWRASAPQLQKEWVDYITALEKRGRYTHVIWPVHCLIGSDEHSIVPELFEAFCKWEYDNIGAIVDYVTKGSNWRREHFSAVAAEVDDPTDPSTQLNTGLIQTLNEADEILWAGEAGSHCLAWTFRDVVAFGDPNIVKKMILFEDCTSPVGGLESKQEDFIREMVAKGMQVMTSAQYLAAA